MSNSVKTAAVAVCMILARVAATMLEPTESSAYLEAELDLEKIFPAEFGEWKIDDRINTIQPTDEGNLADLIYNQTVSRGYRNAKGELIMFVAAYGKRQNDTLQLHLPEICYVANGFRVLENTATALDFEVGNRPVSVAARRLMTESSYRKEPVTYWTRIGDQTPSSALGRQYAKLVYGLRGKIPDGLLIRVSNVSDDSGGSFMLHQAFIQDMLDHMDPGNFAVMLGGVSDGKSTGMLQDTAK